VIDMTVDYETIDIQKSNSITTIIFNQPEKMNPVGATLINELHQVFDQIESDPETKAVIITGKGKAFSAGGDLNTRHKTPADGKRFTRHIGNLVKKMQKIEIPIITAVNGYCLGGGWNLIMGTDVIIASESAVFSQPFANFGLVPDCGGTFFLPRMVGPLRAKELIFTQRKVGSREALELGLVTEVVPPEKLMQRANEWADIFLNSSKTATGLAKSLINQSFKEDLDSMIELESTSQILARQSEEHKEAVRAFINKKKLKHNS
jgi:enoyl-CoA hydratase/carnithine racemase